MYRGNWNVQGQILLILISEGNMDLNMELKKDFDFCHPKSSKFFNLTSFQEPTLDVFGRFAYFITPKNIHVYFLVKSKRLNSGNIYNNIRSIYYNNNNNNNNNNNDINNNIPWVYHIPSPLATCRL